MRYQLYKDLRKRLDYSRIEVKKKFIKYFLINSRKDNILKNKLNYQYNLLLKSYIQTKTRCLLTNRQHSILKIFKLSRISIRNLCGQGILYGLKKSSW